MKALRLVALLVVAACGKQAAAPQTTVEFSLTQAGDSIPLYLGQEAKVDDVYMVLSDVTNESRCARGVQCVWAGDAVASITVHPPCIKQGCKAASFNLALHTNLEPRSGEGWGHKVQLLALLPEPDINQPIDRSKYVAWVRVTKSQ
ncbi:MAG: hypothetical protein H7066_01195 [Cytophagaceae bacterium]|nr:hypothetical protein [Gemmatimonadaceae bacterium]